MDAHAERSVLVIFLFSVVTLLDTNEVFFCHGSDNFTTSTVSDYHTKPVLRTILIEVIVACCSWVT
jgi:hypothetical protein